MWRIFLKNKNLFILIGSIFTLYIIISILQITYIYNTTKSELINDDKYHLEIIVKNIKDTFELDRKKALFLNNLPSIQEIVLNAKKQENDSKNDLSVEEWEDRLAVIFHAYIQANSQIRQIRYIGTNDNGREIVRVERSNGNIKIAEKSELQQKGDTQYFKEAIKLTPGSVLISEIELNKEHGMIDFPEWPTYRIAIGTFDQNMTLLGFVIINIDATDFLNSFRSQTEGYDTYLLNGDHKFLLHPDSHLDFSFEHKNSLFDSWQGYFKTPIEEAPYAISTVEKPNGEVLFSHGVKIKYNTQSKDRYLYVVNTITESTIVENVLKHLIGYQAVSFALFLIVIFTAIIYQRSITAIRIKDEAEIRYETIVNSISECIVTLNSKYNIKRYNNAAKSLFRLNSSAEDFEGNSIFDLIPEVQEGILTAQKTLDNGEPRAEFLISITSLNRETKHFNITLTKIQKLDTSEIDLVLLIHDNTIVFEYRKSLEISNRLLEEKVQERTSELQNALEIADKANKTKSDFLATMSHEIRTPLNGVLGMLNLLANGPLTPRQEENLHIAKSSASLLTQLINDILDFSRIEAGKLTIDNVDFNLINLLHTTTSNISTAANDKDLQLVCDTSEVKSEHVHSDPHRIKQVINNLLSNAIKFTDTGTITLKANTQVRPDGKIEFKCSVIDTGIGIEEEKLNYIFEKFTQATSSTSRLYGGTGLGLSISKQLLHLLGGELTVTSEKGRGSTFSFTIPLAQPHADISIATDSSKSNTVEFLADQTILVVDDNRTNRAIITGLLEAHNATILEAVNGIDALRILNTTNDNSIDIILMDCQMPELDGYQATQCIRNGEAGQKYVHIPIIALTAAAMQGEKEKCLAAGMTDYLAKPVDFEQLILKLQLYIDSTEGISAPIKKAEIDTESIWDKEGALSRLNNSQELLASIYDIFRETSPETLTSLKLALDKLDIDAIHRQAHKLKSPALTVGAIKVAQIALQLESANKEELRSAKDNSLYESLETEYHLFVNLAERELGL